MPISEDREAGRRGTQGDGSGEVGWLVTTPNGDWMGAFSHFEGKPARIEVVNNLPVPIYVAWVDLVGWLRSIEFLQACDEIDHASDGLIVDTFAHHAFVAFHHVDPVPARLEEIPINDFIFHYTIAVGDLDHFVVVDPRADPSDRATAHRPDVSVRTWTRYPVVNTAFKVYEEISINRIRILFEPGVFDRLPQLGSRLIKELHRLCALLPHHALRELRTSTPIYLNLSLQYGSLASPVDGEGITYHPERAVSWLTDNGLAPCKCGSIEIYNANLFDRDMRHWEEGVSLLRMLCYAYHDKCCPDGYDNEDILQAYRHAVRRRIYEAEPNDDYGYEGKGTEMTEQAAAKEFFAEMSVAYLLHQTDAGNSTLGEDGASSRRERDEEETKSAISRRFVVTRRQPAETDPATLQLLRRMWADPGSPRR